MTLNRLLNRCHFGSCSGADRAAFRGRRLAQLCALWGLLLSTLVVGSARAQPALRALDAVWLTPRLTAPHDALVLAASAGYGAMGQVAGTNGAHHRLAGALALAVSSRLGLAAELRFDGRWDLHHGTDDSLVGDPRLLLRYARVLTERVAAGLEVTVWTPGATAPSIDLAATSVDVLVAGEFQLSPRLALSAALGPRFDRSEQTVDREVTLSRSDTIVLGVSSYHALLARVALSTQLRGVQLAGELSADTLLGQAAPRFLDSPLRAGMSARHKLERAKRVELSALLGVLLSGRAPFREDRYVPYEPRVVAFLGVRYQLEPMPPKKPAPPPPPVAPVVVAPVAEPVELFGALLVQVSDEAGEPLPDVRVAIADGAEQRTGGAGRVLFETVRLGERTVEVSASGFASQTLSFSASAELPAELSVTLLPAREESVLRVQVRDAQSGAPLSAQCSLLPAKGKRAAQRFVTAADGSHELSLPDGNYRVTVQAAGYAAQTRAVEVRALGVTLFNIDLTPEAP